MSNEQRLIALIESDSRIMEMLGAVRSLDLEHWCIAAGTIRNKVWDDLHSFAEPILPSDVDVLFFDKERRGSDYEEEIEARLSVLVPNVRWEAVNQAVVHSYTGDPEPYGSIEEAMSRWADLVTAVGAYLNNEGRITIVAPAGLDDLFELQVRPNLVTPTAAKVYRDRMANKGWQERWPMLRIEGLQSVQVEDWIGGSPFPGGSSNWTHPGRADPACRRRSWTPQGSDRGSLRRNDLSS